MNLPRIDLKNKDLIIGSYNEAPLLGCPLSFIVSKSVQQPTNML